MLLDQCHRDIAEDVNQDSAFCATDELLHAKNVLPENDLVLVGANTNCLKKGVSEEMRKTAKVISQRHCSETNSELIGSAILHHLKRRGSIDPYWISMNADVFKPSEFKSNSHSLTGRTDGVPLDFVYSFLKRFSANATGLDFSEINFMSSDDVWRHSD